MRHLMEDKTVNQNLSDHNLVALHLIQEFSKIKGFTVLSNISKPEHYIGNFIPDIILFHKESNKPVTIIEVRNNGNIAICLQQWKSMQNIPATLYLFVPEDEITIAKQVAQIIGITVRFATYSIKEKVVSIKYE